MTLRDTSSNLVAKPQLFLSVFQGVHGTRAPVPQVLHLGGLLLERLAGLHQSLQLVLGRDITEASQMNLQYSTLTLLLLLSTQYNKLKINGGVLSDCITGHHLIVSS